MGINHIIIIMSIVHCDICNLDYKTNEYYRRHLITRRHYERSSDVKTSKHDCVCGRYYTHIQSLYVHRRKCKQHQNMKATEKPVPIPTKPAEVITKPCNDNIIEEMQQTIEAHKRERQIMKDEIARLFHAAATAAAATVKKETTTKDKRKKIGKGIRLQIAENQHNMCGECETILSPYFQLDHVVGLQFGGTDEESNLMALCYECHVRKSICENQCRKQIRDSIQAILRGKMQT